MFVVSCFQNPFAVFAAADERGKLCVLIPSLSAHSSWEAVRRALASIQWTTRPLVGSNGVDHSNLLFRKFVGSLSLISLNFTSVSAQSRNPSSDGIAHVETGLFELEPSRSQVPPTLAPLAATIWVKSHAVYIKTTWNMIRNYCKSFSQKFHPVCLPKLLVLVRSILQQWL